MTGTQTRKRTASRPARWLAALLAALWLACPAATASINFATAFSEIWWNSKESGWGVNVVHQNQLMYLTFYIYRADGTPYWVSALLTYVPGNLNGPYVFTGDLYENHGPWYGGPYAPPATVRKAGTATFTVGVDGYSATLSYTVDGVPVSKTVERFKLQDIDYDGIFYGVVVSETDSCTPSTLNGQVVKDHGTITVTQQGSAMKIVAAGSLSTCTFNGTYAQSGSPGTLTGNYSCTDGTAGTFVLEYMQRTVFGMTGQLSGKNAQCSFDGLIGMVSID